MTAAGTNQNTNQSTSQNRLMRAIAIFKLAKAALFFALGIGILHLIHSDIASTLDHWISRTGLDPGNHLLDRVVSSASNIPPRRIRELGIGSFVYSALFLTEGTGLWLRKRWAEWFTVIITSSLVPLEIWELHRHPSATKVIVLLLNLAIVGYLLYQIRKGNSEQTR